MIELGIGLGYDHDIFSEDFDSLNLNNKIREK